MADLDVVIERCHSAEFKQQAEDLAENLWAFITECITLEGMGPTEEWPKFYSPALRVQVLRRLSERCEAGSEMAHEVFCNAVREASPNE